MSLVCNAPWNGLFVWNDGTVSYCGRTKAKGNLRQQDFRSFWNSKPVEEARSLILGGHYFSSGCPPTCCLLTSKKPDEYVKYFDSPPEAVSCISRRHASTQPPGRPPRSYAENLLLIERDIEAHRSVVSTFPSTLSLQLFNYCSLRCPMCCFGVIPANQKKPTINIIDSLVLDRVKEVYPFVARVDLVGGELFDIPFDENPLVRVLADMAEVAADTIKVTITTNGQHLSRQWADHLLQYPFIDIIAFSIDSFDPEVYARTRVSGSLDRVRRSLENVQTAKARRNATYPIIKMNTILGVHTHDGVASFLENARLLGADEVEFQKLVVMGQPEFFAENNLFSPKHVEKLIRVWRDLAASDFRSNRNEIMGMISAYLAHLGCWNRLLEEEVSIPFAMQLRQDNYIGPVSRKRHAAQTFVARRASISRIRFVAGTYQRHNSCDLHVSIEGPKGPIVRSTINAAALEDNAWVTVDVPKTTLEIGREYALTVRSSASDVANAIAIRCAPEGTGLSFGGVRQQGEMAYMLF
ncbi:radical SAM protein [Bradyrhizobium sp. LHD-71]|uniref:radical SAM protein n=1 Tax=Bradyrhizobium sp. LHD-71 TaxID=3072141 RepID=UPI00280FF0CD|nr:radical SAM protein [Bradyrhizobium sp. LHD-71]MDQ8730949.1 radical SAM protein [Bradyrhizobium sp. LHD-71]